MATDNKQPLAVLLRKCIVLAYELKNDRLKTWANQELNGYSNDDELPDYRKLPAQAKGTFVSSHWNLPSRSIPPAAMDEGHRWAAETVRLGEPVSSYEVMAAKGEGTVHFPWISDMVLYYQRRFIRGFALVAAWQEVPYSAIAAVLDTIRTRILNTALELRLELGNDGEHLGSMTPVEAEKVDRTIVNQIYGGNVYLSTGNSNMTATTVQRQQQNIVAGDWEHLEQILTQSGVSESEIKELSTAVKEDGQTFGTRVKNWVTRVGPQVLSSGVKVGAKIGADLLTEYVKQYLS